MDLEDIPPDEQHIVYAGEDFWRCQYCGTFTKGEGPNGPTCPTCFTPEHISEQAQEFVKGLFQQSKLLP